MGIFLTLVAALALWVVLWGASIMKSFDAFIVSMLLVLLAVTATLLRPYLPGGSR
jgi:hypothetical protein